MQEGQTVMQAGQLLRSAAGADIMEREMNRSRAGEARESPRCFGERVTAARIRSAG
jgi:hypothetical protein